MTSKEYALRDLEALNADNKQLLSERKAAFASGDMTEYRAVQAGIAENNERIRNIAECYLLPGLLSDIAAPEGSESAAYTILAEMFDRDFEAMERAAKNDELTVNTDADGKAWLVYTDLSDTTRCMAVCPGDKRFLKSADAISELFGWE